MCMLPIFYTNQSITNLKLLLFATKLPDHLKPIVNGFHGTNDVYTFDRLSINMYAKTERSKCIG